MKIKRGCQIEGCKRTFESRGFCHMHYLRFSRGYNIGDAIPRKKPNGTFSHIVNGTRIWIIKYPGKTYRPSLSFMNKLRFGGLKDDVLKRDNYKCRICGMTNKEHQKTYGRRITVDHIDGEGRNSEFPHNSMENLWTLCFSCHGRRDSLRNWMNKGKSYSYDILYTYRLEGA